MKNINELRQWYIVGSEQDGIPDYAPNMIKTLKEARIHQRKLQMLFPDTEIKIYKCFRLFSCVEVTDDPEN